MNIFTKILSLTFVFIITLTIFGGVISANLQDHSQMITHGSCAEAEECIFHQTRIVFENNAISVTAPLQLAILAISTFLLFVITKPNEELHIKSYLYYWLKLLKFKDKWHRYLQRSIDKLKIQPAIPLIQTY
jgi:hypothetical protein